jgi:NADPH:quinone reductase-like Zn-dependent oxidoreductase
MRALVIGGFGGPEVLSETELADPEPGPGEVRVQVRAVAVARTKDVATRAGRPPFADQITAFPHVLGSEHAGVVDAVGLGVDRRLLGCAVGVSAVLTCGQCTACGRGREEACARFALVGVHRQGSYAQYCVVPADNVCQLAEEVSFVQAAALAANGPVAAAQLSAGGVGAGDTVLVLGAGGSLGSMVAALAAFRGARVIGVDRLRAKPGCLQGLPLAATLDGDDPGLTESIVSAAPGGIDCVVDNLGLGALFQAYMPALAALGTIVVSGAISQDPILVRLLPFYLNSHSLIGVRTGNRHHRAALWTDVAAGFCPPAGFVHPTPWTRAIQAHTEVEYSRARGQVVLEIEPVIGANAVWSANDY